MAKVFKYKPQNRTELEIAIEHETAYQGRFADLNCIDTSCITDMFKLFYYSDFNQDISSWDVSGLEYAEEMFDFSDFQQNIWGWNLKSLFLASQLYMSH